jgi:hypothetical protein
MRASLDCRDTAVPSNFDAELAGGVRQRVGCTVWIKPTVLRNPKATEEVIQEDVASLLIPFNLSHKLKRSGPLLRFTN